MTTKPRASKFRIRRGGASGAVPAPAETEGRVLRTASAPAAAANPSRTDAPGTAQQPVERPRPRIVETAAAAAARSEAEERREAGPQHPPRQPAGGSSREMTTQVRSGPPQGDARSGEVSSAAQVASEQDMDAIRREGLTGRQLRMARRVAQKHGLAVTSDFDAVRQLRANGIDPFQRSSVLELVVPDGAKLDDGGGDGPGGTRPQLPQTTPGGRGRQSLPRTVDTARNLPSTEVLEAAERRAAEIGQIQRDMAGRRRRKAFLLLTRLAFFVLLPTFAAGYYFYVMATPMYATKSEFVIQQASPTGAGAGLGGLFQGTSMATQQDSITVQSYLASRDAMTRLDAEHDFKAHFSEPDIDPIQRLPENATNEDAFAIYQDRVKVSYDPTEGILKMEVVAADPETSQEFSEALIGYAEERVDQLTQRLREDQMSGAQGSYEAAERRREAALAEWLSIQEELEVVDPVGETSARTTQISQLESERQQLMLDLQNRLNVRRPNEAQVDALRSQIASIESLIAQLREEMTAASETGTSLASKNTELRLAEENYTFQTVMVQQALQQMESAQVEANRQVRYLSLGVPPTAPDKATYPRAFENTVLAFLILAGVYLMISITASILREQVAS